MRVDTHHTVDSALTDDQIVARVCEGDEKLFEILMHRHDSGLLTHARRILREETDAEDAVQQAWLVAFSHLPDAPSGGRFGSWLNRIGHREAVAIRQHRRGTHGRADRLAGEFTRGEAFGDATPEDEAAEHELTELVDLAISDLPPPYRSVVVHRELLELTTAEAAVCLDLTEKSVRERHHRARAMLKSVLAARLGAPRPTP